MIYALPGFAAVLALPAVALLHRWIRRRRIARDLRICGTRGITGESFVRIGGIDQWIGLRGEDRENPALLMIHGGPGASCSIFTPIIRS